MRVLIVEDEPYTADAIRDGLRLETIAADIAGDGDTDLELLSTNSYDVAVLDHDIPRLRRQARRDAVLLESALGVLSSPLPRPTDRPADPVRTDRNAPPQHQSQGWSSSPSFPPAPWARHIRLP
jgi:hypothetical protein